MMPRQTFAIALALVVSAAPAAAQRPWVEVTSPHLTVASDAGAGRDRGADGSLFMRAAALEKLPPGQ